MMIDFFDAHPAENIGELNGGYRFWYSVFSAVLTNELWALGDGDTGTPLMHCDDKGQTLVLVWPSLGSTEYFARAEAKDATAYRMNFDQFLREGIASFERSGFRISPCPAPDQPFVSCLPSVFAKQAEIARSLRHRLSSLSTGCKRATNRDCRCKLCGAASLAAMEDPRVAVAMRGMALGKLWTVQNEWRTAYIQTDESSAGLVPIWDTEAGATEFVAAYKSEVPGLHPCGVSVIDWLYFWTGWLSMKNYRLDLNPLHSAGQSSSAGQIAPLVFDRLIRRTFTRLSSHEFPKCY